MLFTVQSRKWALLEILVSLLHFAWFTDQMISAQHFNGTMANMAETTAEKDVFDSEKIKTI